MLYEVITIPALRGEDGPGGRAEMGAAVVAEIVGGAVRADREPGGDRGVARRADVAIGGGHRERGVEEAARLGGAPERVGDERALGGALGPEAVAVVVSYNFV